MLRSYAAPDSPPEERRSTSRSESRSGSEGPEKITFITSFGGNESEEECSTKYVVVISAI